MAIQRKKGHDQAAQLLALSEFDRAMELAQKSKVKTQRIPRYKDADGQYLDVAYLHGQYYIAWWIPEDSDFGLFLANRTTKAEDGEETFIAIRTCVGFFSLKKLDLPKEGHDFVFESERQARECLRIINAELHWWRSKKPIPDWAKMALSQGWKPPDGWKP